MFLHLLYLTWECTSHGQMDNLQIHIHFESLTMPQQQIHFHPHFISTSWNQIYILYCLFAINYKFICIMIYDIHIYICSITVRIYIYTCWYDPLMLYKPFTLQYTQWPASSNVDSVVPVPNCDSTLRETFCKMLWGLQSSLLPSLLSSCHDRICSANVQAINLTLDKDHLKSGEWEFNQPQ
jgi:hypothetical protein